MDISAQLEAAEKKHGLPAGTMGAIFKQETGGKDEYLKDPTKYHYGLNKDGKRIAPHTGQISTAFGPFGILESTAKDPGYGVEPLRSKSLEDQIDFSAAYLAGRTKHAGSLRGGLAGYGEGEKYAASVLRRAGRTDAGAVPAVAPRPETGDVERPDGWPVLPTARAQAGDHKAATRAQQDALLQTSGAQMNATTGGTEAHTDQGVAAAEALERQRKETGFGAAFQAARRDPRIQPMFTALDAVLNEREQTPEGWTYASIKDELEAGLTDEEREYARENVVGPQSMQSVKAQLAYRRELDEQYGLAGGFTAFAGQMAGGAMDPIGFALGMGVGKALQGVGIGSRALANAGRATAARGSFIAENALANVSVELLQDTLGEVKTTGDYAMAAVGGAAFAAPWVKSAGMPDIGKVVTDIGDGIKTQAIEKQVADIDQAVAAGYTEPSQIARHLEAKEIADIKAAVTEVQQPQIREHAVPQELQQSLRDEFDGTGQFKPEDLDLPPLPEAKETVIPWSRTGTFNPEGHPVSTGRELLDAVESAPTVKPGEVGLAQYFKKLFSKEVLDIPVMFDTTSPRGEFNPNNAQVKVPSKVQGKADEVMPFAGEHTVSTALHEMVHAATHTKIESFVRGKVPEKLRPTMEQFQDLHARFSELVLPGERGSGYASKNLHEFAAQVLSDQATRDVLKSMPGKAVDGWTPSSAWEEFLGVLSKLFGLKDDSALGEAAKLLDKIISDTSPYVEPDGSPALQGPKAAAPARAAATQRRHLTDLYRHAEDFIRRNPIRTERLKTITAKIGGMSDGLVLASSKNPVMQMIAALVTETTTGAAGRKATVAVRVHMLRQRLMGDSIPDYTHAFDQWAKGFGVSTWDKVAKGDGRRSFDKQVYTEIVNRREAGYQPHSSADVVRAADALEKTFQAAADAQREAGVLGSNALAPSSRGYVPQALDGNKLQTLSMADLKLVEQELATQFASRLGWRQQDADAFAPFYLERVRKQAQGSQGIDATSAGGNVAQLVRDTLDDMTINPDHRDRVSAMSAIFSGQGHTKKRLDLDLRVNLRQGLDLMDVYNTDPLGLTRAYTHRVSGNVALTESGILGVRGIRQLREAAGNPVETGTLPTAEEFDAFDRVMAEIMGTPVAGRVVSAGATNLGLLVNLQKLGGLVWTQAAETYQLVNVLGLRSAMGGVASLPRMLSEIKAMKTGGLPSNHILGSIEQYGGQFGMENYKMVAPLDPPDAQLGIYMDQAGLASRLLRAGGHLQSKISGFRGLMAAQHRMAAEQIVMKAARMIRDSSDDVALRDMGFTDSVVQALKQDMPNVAKWDANGHLQSFDLTRVSDPAMAEAFVQSVHRGVSQIIQGTFVGERNKWMHNDYLRLMLQLRTFGLIAAEKQWGRTRMNEGVASAAGKLIGHMAMVLPLHMARVYTNSLGREDREKFLEDNTNPVALARATMNYASMAGLTGDVMDVAVGLWAGWGGDEQKELLGARTQGTGVAQVIPAAGVIDQALRTAQGKGTVYSALKQAPFGSLWWMVPAVNLTKED